MGNEITSVKEAAAHVAQFGRNASIEIHDAPMALVAWALERSRHRGGDLAGSHRWVTVELESGVELVLHWHVEVGE
jgi:hypothetical protein